MKKVMKTLTGLIACLAMVAFVSCSQEQKGPTDAQIASIAAVANQIDVDYADIALEKTQNSEAKKFAETMKKDHSAILKSVQDLANKLGVTPDDDNETTKSLKDERDKTVEKLKGLEGKDFDKAYIDNEVEYHKQVIDAVKNTLIPSAENEDLKGALESVLPNLEQHLEMAKQFKKDIDDNKGYAPEFTDPQIASIVVAANQIDVDYAEIALKKSENEVVRKFAETMKNDHTQIKDSAIQLAQKLGVTPDDDNALTKQLNDQAEQTKEKLNGLSGADFDKAYIDNEVAYHDAVINAVKDVLIPQTENKELKQALKDVAPNLVQHLEMAKKDQAEIEK